MHPSTHSFLTTFPYRQCGKVKKAQALSQTELGPSTDPATDDVSLGKLLDLSELI